MVIQELRIIQINILLHSRLISSNLTKQMLQYGLEYIKNHVYKGINSYLGDQEVISISLKKFNKISRGLYTLPLYTVGIPSEQEIKSLCLVHPIHCNKEFSLKERLLCYVDENKYYTSLQNRYIFSKDQKV